VKKFTFPTSRVFAFNDAVFSIAITLLVLDIKVPSKVLIASVGFWEAMQNLIPNFIGFVVSFLVIALYWKFYLLFSRYIDVFDKKLIWHNIFLLLFVALLPFSTSLFVSSPLTDGPFTFYCINLILLSFFNLLMLKVVLRRARLKMDKITSQWLQFRAINTLIVWIIALILAYVLPQYARLSFILIFIFQFFGKIYFKRKIKTAKIRNIS